MHLIWKRRRETRRTDMVGDRDGPVAALPEGAAGKLEKEVCLSSGRLTTLKEGNEPIGERHPLKCGGARLIEVHPGVLQLYMQRPSRRRRRGACGTFFVLPECGTSSRHCCGPRTFITVESIEERILAQRAELKEILIHGVGASRTP